MKRFSALVFTCLIGALPTLSYAAVTLLDKDDWKVMMSGFVKLDMYRDSKRSFTESMGNKPVDRPGGQAGTNPRLQFSVRNTRLAFSILPPQHEGKKSKGYFEFDLAGYNPEPGANNSEASFFASPTMRVRHAYFNTEQNGWTFLAGQTWTLFGWSPTYVLSTASVPAGPGTIYQRTAQFSAMKSLVFAEQAKLQMGLAVARPSQRDSGTPNVDGGVKFSWSGLSSGFTSATGEVKAEPLSLALSGTVRQFAVASSTATDLGLSRYNGSAFAIDTMIPILPSHDGKDTGNTLTLTGEFSAGKGYGDAFPGWTGNLAQLPAAGTTSSAATNLDAGQGAWNSVGTFSLIKLQSWNAQLQYHFPTGWNLHSTVGYARLAATDMLGKIPLSAGKTVYDQTDMTFINFFHDCTEQIRMAVEYAKVNTHYVDGVTATNDRYQVSAYFRF